MNTEPQQEGKSPVNLKRRMLIVLGIILAVILLMSVLVTVLENWLAKKQIEQPIHGTPQTIIFHTPNYDEDITKDTSYMDLDRQIYYADPYTGVTVSLKSDSYWEHGDGVELLCHMIESIIAGNHEKYNRFFSDAYFDVEPEKEPFTPQKLYNITITLQSREEVTEEVCTVVLLNWNYRNVSGNCTYISLDRVCYINSRSITRYKNIVHTCVCPSLVVCNESLRRIENVWKCRV